MIQLLIPILPARALLKITPQLLRQRRCEIADTPDMHTHILLLRRTRERKRMILPKTNFGTTQENILSRLGLEVLLPDLDLTYPRGMLNDL